MTWGDGLQAATLVVGSSAAICVGLAVIWKSTSRPRHAVRWVWRRLVSQPVSAWAEALFRREVDEAIAPLDARVEQLDRRLSLHMAGEEVDAVDRRARQQEMDAWRECVDDWRGQTSRTLKQVTDYQHLLRVGHEEIKREVRDAVEGNPEVRRPK